MFEPAHLLQGGKELFDGWDWSGELDILDEDANVIGSVKASAMFDRDGLLIETDPDLEDYQVDQLLELRDEELGAGRNGG